MTVALLEVSELTVDFPAGRILRGVSFSLEKGQTLGVVGESGCGKSMTGLALMGMIPTNGVTGGSIQLDGRELVGLREREWQSIRGQEIAMVMQDPFSSLNPVMRVGEQIAEVYQAHFGTNRAEGWRRAVEMLRMVGVPQPEASARKYPHQMSGGQRQRVVIAIAFACRPKVLVADEPTTALDVTLQAQILRLLRQLKEEENASVIFISHDIGVIASISDLVAVFYAGRIVEFGTAEGVLRHPQHPYTKALLAAMPDARRDRLEAIPGQPPNLLDLPKGCSFQSRCPYRFERCEEDPPLLPGVSSNAACWLVDDKARAAYPGNSSS